MIALNLKVEVAVMVIYSLTTTSHSPEITLKKDTQRYSTSTVSMQSEPTDAIPQHLI